MAGEAAPALAAAEALLPVAVLGDDEPGGEFPTHAGYGPPGMVVTNAQEAILKLCSHPTLTAPSFGGLGMLEEAERRLAALCQQLCAAPSAGEPFVPEAALSGGIVVPLQRFEGSWSCDVQLLASRAARVQSFVLSLPAAPG